MNYKISLLIYILVFHCTAFTVKAAATYPIYVIFDTEDATSEKLSDMNASSLQTLIFNGSNWAPTNVERLSYSGSWNATTNLTDFGLTLTPTNGNYGEYYIVTTEGNTDLSGGPATDSWKVGDWVVWNEEMARWEKIDNGIGVQRFAGRDGVIESESNDYTWEQIDKTISSISDLTDVNTTGIALDKVLKWDGSGWTIDNELNEGGTILAATLPLVSSGGATPDISINLATATQSGYLSMTDWNIFNNKQTALTTGTSSNYIKGNITLGNFVEDVLATALTGFSPMAGVVAATDTILEALNKLDANIDLKESSITRGELSETNSNVLIITNGVNSVIGSGTLIDFTQADASNSGYLSSADWSKFNSKAEGSNFDNITLEVDANHQLQIIDRSITSAKMTTDLEHISTDYTVTPADNNKIFLISGETTITLPSDASRGFTLTIKNIDQSNTATIDVTNGGTIELRKVSKLTSQYTYETLISDGSNWHIVNQHGNFTWCPTGYIPVHGIDELGTQDFCVMKYEAKNNGSGIPISQASGAPWVSIDSSSAFTACESVSEPGFAGTFALISNSEWMTIARSLEGVPSNWSGGSVGSGCIFRGNISIDDNCSYNGDNPESGNNRNFKARLTLPNGEEIWDFSGNVKELVDWKSDDSVFTKGPTDGDDGEWNQFNDIIGSVTKNDLGPHATTYLADQGMGQWYPYTEDTHGATVRGGHWENATEAGIFTLQLNQQLTIEYITTSFRCVYRP